MERKLKVAAIQMDASPAPKKERLERADKLVAGAANDGAQFVLLPELFNIGYGYIDENYANAEAIDGLTATWLRETAAKYGIHLGGAILLWDDGDIYDALLLFAPDGRMWRYDKQYPWGWERAYFRGRKEPVVAHTDLGDIGMLICWDVAHPKLWKQYAGKVDFMAVSSCPPDVTNPSYMLPQGGKLTLDDFGPLGKLLKDTGRLLFGDMVNQQTGWLGVPTVQTGGSGHIRTTVPRAFLSFFSYAVAVPTLIKYLPQASQMEMECDFVQGNKIIDRDGSVKSESIQSDGDSYTLAEIDLLPSKGQPRGDQPGSLLPWLTYLSSDFMLPILMRPLYRRAVKKSKLRL